jgi:divalent metal cation (Fe/Co/Zn/Cd) transporter
VKLNLNHKERTMALAVGVNLFVILLKFGLARVSGSMAMSASAWHSFADIFVVCHSCRPWATNSIR